MKELAHTSHLKETGIAWAHGHAIAVTVGPAGYDQLSDERRSVFGSMTGRGLKSRLAPELAHRAQELEAAPIHRDYWGGKFR